jgi:glycosyl transferase-like sugar-binding protein
MNFFSDAFRQVEDDRLRSRYVQELLREGAPGVPPPGSSKIPKVIVQFWHDSGCIPVDVRECLDSWEPLTRRGFGFKRIVFDDNEARRFIGRAFGSLHVAAFDRCRHPAMRSDYFRLCYIFTHGGFYVDADEVYRGGDCRSWFRDNRLKVQPLCYDTLTDTMIHAAMFTAKQDDSASRIFYINNNPLIGPASHPVIALALARSTELLLRHSKERFDVQFTTGPGNFTVSLVRHAIGSRLAGKTRDFQFLTDWGATSISRWPLSYRDDERNWRLWTLMSERSIDS